MAKAWVLHEIGDIRLEDVDIPEPAENEVLVNVKAVGICGSDVPRVYETGAHRMPLIPGHEFSGVVVKTGAKVSADLEGMRVAVSPKIPCRKCEMCAKGETDLCLNYDYTGSRRDGAFGEYVCVPVDNLIELVDNISFEEGAMIEPLAVAANAVRTGCAGIDPSDNGVKIAVCGMGTIGLMVVMLLMDMGFSDIYVIGNKDSHRDKAIDIEIFPEHYCDMRVEEPVAWLKEKTNGVSVYFECVGSNESIRYGLETGAPKSRQILVGNPRGDMSFSRNTYWEILRKQMSLIGIWNSSYRKALDVGSSRQEGCSVNAKGSGTAQIDDWHYVLSRLEAGGINPSKLITHRFSLNDLEKGLLIMRDKTEDYCKIMICSERL